jgi:methyl-accepting chemotaxis protein
MRLSDYKLTLRIGTFFAVLIATLIILTVANLNNNDIAQEKLEQLTSDIAVKTNIVETMEASMRDNQIITRNIMLSPNATAAQPEINKLYLARKIYDAEEARLDNLFTDEDDRKVIHEMTELRRVGRPMVDRVVSLSLKDLDQEAINTLSKDVMPNYEARLKLIGHLLDMQKAKAHVIADNATAAHRSLRTMIYVLGGLALLLGTILGLVITSTGWAMDTEKKLDAKFMGRI